MGWFTLWLAHIIVRPPATPWLLCCLCVQMPNYQSLCAEIVRLENLGAHTHTQPGRSSSDAICIYMLVWIMCRTMVMNIPFITARWRPGRQACIELLMHPSATLSRRSHMSWPRAPAQEMHARASVPAYICKLQRRLGGDLL